MSEPKILGKEDIAQLAWQDYEQGLAVKAYLESFIIYGPERFVKNVKGEMKLLCWGKHLLPLFLPAPPTSALRSYVGSMLGQYVDYAWDALKRKPAGKAQRILYNLVFSLGRRILAAAGLERCVLVNCWLLSTNLYPQLDLSILDKVIALVQKEFPDRAIIFKSVNPTSDPGLAEALGSAMAWPVLSRLNYFFNPLEVNPKKKRAFVRDLKAWEKQQGLYWQELEEADYDLQERLIALYQAVYFGRYSKLNPDYAPDYISLLQASGLFNVGVLYEEGKPLGVQLISERNGVITTPFIGHDPKQPKEKALYRHLNTALMQQAIDEGKLLNMSSGAAGFKKQRGGKGSFEYNYCFASHLGAWRRWPWQLLRYMGDQYGKDAMAKFDAA